MILILAYYLREEPTTIRATKCISALTNNDESAYLESDVFKNDLYFMKVQILEEYYEDLFEDDLDIVANKSEIEDHFDALFEYSFWTLAL